MSQQDKSSANSQSYDAPVIGRPAPDFCLDAIELNRKDVCHQTDTTNSLATAVYSSDRQTKNSDEFVVDQDEQKDRPEQFPIRLADYRGKWLVLFFYPRDFSFVCPTELTRFSARKEEFLQANASILAVSVDTIETHRRFLESSPNDGGVGRLRFPLASDPQGELASKYRVWDSDAGLPLRGLFVVDPDGVIQYSVVHSMSVGRSVDETLRVLQALQSGGLCPVDWTDADGNIDLNAALQEGRVIGHYRIESELGGGSFGTVLSAWDQRLHRPVALKVLRHNVKKSRDNSLAEARSVATLNHPNICSIYAVDVDEGLPMIVMPLIDGNPLSNVLKMNPLTGWSKRICKVFKGIVSGVRAAHGKNIVHGDLKPANFMIDPDDHVTILDFGLSKYVDDIDPEVLQEKFFNRRITDPSPGSKVSASLSDSKTAGSQVLADSARTILSNNELVDVNETVDFQMESFVLAPAWNENSNDSQVDLSGSKIQSDLHGSSEKISSVHSGTGTTGPKGSAQKRTLSGTPAYMAPEQVHGNPATKQTDIFSLGLILYELTTGRRALEGNRLSDVFSQLNDSSYLASLSRKLPAPFDSVASKMLRPSPEQRPTADEIFEQIELWEPFVEATSK